MINVPAVQSPVSVLRKNVISCFHCRVACKPALGIVPLRRLISQGTRGERTGGGVIIERGPSPSSAVCELVAVLYHEVHVMQGARHRGIRKVLVLLRVPMDLRHLGAVGER